MLEALKTQEYPHSKIEHIIMDGGSSQKYIALARSYNARVLVRKKLKNDALKRSKIAIELSKGEIILFLEPDNIICGTSWLTDMVKPFIDDPKIIGTFSIYNSATQDMPILTRYTALLGVNDPTVYYLKKSEKLAQFETEYVKGACISKNSNYITVEFNPISLPVLGDNGHMVRRKIIAPIASKMKTFLHTDAFMLACKQGHRRYGIVKNSIVHHTGSNIIDFFTRRIRYKSRYEGSKGAVRDYKVFDIQNPQDRKNIFLFILYSVTYIEPLWLSIRGYAKKHDIAWFLHPIICFLAVVAYGLSSIMKKRI